MGVARFSGTGDGRAEVAVTVSDDCALKGLASLLMSQLIESGAQRGITALYSMDPSDNDAMRKLASFLGFERSADPDDATQVIYTLRLHGLDR